MIKRMKNLSTILLMVCMGALCALQLHGQEAPTISVQGTLKDASGASVADGTYSVTFRLFNQETGGNPVWQEVATVEVVGGIYSHYLGSVTPLNAANFASTLYMGLKVGSYELNPRTRMTYAPYTFSSNTAQKVLCSGAVGDVKYSVLNPTQFAAVNGDCWVPFDGRSLASSAQLRQITGWTSLPNAGGVFLRTQEFANSPDRDPGRTSSSPIAAVQAEELKSHNHAVTDPGHKHGTSAAELGLLPNIVPLNYGFTVITTETNSFGTLSISNATTGITIAAAGGAETRPVNMNVWVYIRIN
jgi:hypothetical protein